MPRKILVNPCADCKEKDATLVVRRRHLCSECYTTYVHSKILKRLESYRLRKSNQKECRRIILPLSGGISSLVLLHIVDQQLQKQFEHGRGRVAFEIHALVVDVSSVLESSPDEDFTERVKQRYPNHTFSTVTLDRVFELDGAGLDEILSPDQDGFTHENLEDSEKRLKLIVETIPSPTSRADIVETLLVRLIAAFAKNNSCDSIFWGHSDSRLAARALSSVAKGRGSSIPFQVLDGPTPFGVIFNFPVRDLFKAELSLFSTTNTSFPSKLVIADVRKEDTSVSIRELSIDQLITNYITTQGEKYPSVMANVVRTAGKLQAPDMSEQSAKCQLCGMLVEDHVEGKMNGQNICYGCARSSESIKSLRQ